MKNKYSTDFWLWAFVIGWLAGPFLPLPYIISSSLPLVCFLGIGGRLIYLRRSDNPNPFKLDLWIVFAFGLLLANLLAYIFLATEKFTAAAVGCFWVIIIWRLIVIFKSKDGAQKEIEDASSATDHGKIDFNDMETYEEVARAQIANSGSYFAKGGVALLKNPASSLGLFAVGVGIVGGAIFTYVFGFLITLFKQLFRRGKGTIKSKMKQSQSVDITASDHGGGSEEVPTPARTDPQVNRTTRNHYLDD